MIKLSEFLNVAELMSGGEPRSKTSTVSIYVYMYI